MVLTQERSVLYVCTKVETDRSIRSKVNRGPKISKLCLFSAVLYNGPGGPGPRAPKPQGPQTADALIFSSRENEISVTNCVLFTG